MKSSTQQAEREVFTLEKTVPCSNADAVQQCAAAHAIQTFMPETCTQNPRNRQK
jgi:hypothetical protein